MTLREDLRPALRALGERPGVVLVGIAIAGVATLVPVVAAVGTSVVVPSPDVSVRATPTLDVVLAPVVAVATLVPVVALFGGLFGPLGAPPERVGATLGRATRTIGRSYAGLLAVAGLATTVAAGVAIALALVWLPLDTAVRYVRYAIADPGPPYATESLLWLVGTLVVGFSVGSALVRLADTAYLYDDRSPTAAIVTSLRFARHHPLSLAGFYLLVGTVAVSGLILSVAVPALLVPSEPDPVVALVAGVPVVGITLAVIAAVQATYYRRTVAPAIERLPDSDPVPWGRITVAFVLVLGAVAGAAVVRSHEIRPVSDDRTALPEAPDRAYETALANTVASSYHAEMAVANRTAGEGLSTRTVQTHDEPDRQYELYITGDDITLGGYFDAGVLGQYPGGEVAIDDLRRDRANWSRYPGPGFGLAHLDDGDVFGALPGEDADWRIAERTDDELTLHIEDRAALERAIEDVHVQGTQHPLEAGSHATVVIDRETRTLSRGVLHLVTAETGTLRYVTTVEGVGTTDLERPPALGERTGAEWLWATVYY